jgi:hypothetical protein
LRQRDVFHQRQIGKAADRPKCLAGDKNRLVAGGDPGEPRAPIDHPGDECEQWMAPGDAQVETAPTAVQKCARDQAIRIIGQRGIGVEEQENVTAAERHPGIHRCAAVVRTRDHAIGQGARQRRSAIAAATIDDNHFGAAGAQRRQCLQCSGDDRRLVERRNDDRQPPQFATHAARLPTKARSGNLGEEVKQTAWPIPFWSK